MIVFKEGGEDYPGFFSAHSISIANSEKEKAKSVMKDCFKHMKKGLFEVLQADNNVSVDAFSSCFEEQDFIEISRLQSLVW